MGPTLCLLLNSEIGLVALLFARDVDFVLDRELVIFAFVDDLFFQVRAFNRYLGSVGEVLFKLAVAVNGDFLSAIDEVEGEVVVACL